MAESPVLSMAAPPPIREAAPLPIHPRVAAMQDLQQPEMGGSPPEQAKQIGERILSMIHAVPQHRAKLTEALRLITEVAQASLAELAESQQGSGPQGPAPDGSLPGAPPPLTGASPTLPQLG